jgi:hypothetical protein
MSSVKEDDRECARLWLSDLIHIRRMSKTIVMSKIVFENLKIKLNTISNIVNLVSILSPTIAAIKNIRSSVVPYIPESERSLPYFRIVRRNSHRRNQVGSYI